MAHYRPLCHLIGLLLLICATSPSNALKCLGRRASPGRHITCYTSSTNLAHLEDAICRCTILVHQGHDLQSLDASGLRSLQDIRKEANPDLKVVMSISDKYKLLKNSARMRHRLAVNLTQILKKVDGVELNITAGNKDRLVSFIKDLKDEMANENLEKLILLALPTKPEDLAKQFELKELSKYVDVFTVTTHYLKDSDETYRTFHPSRLMGLFDMLNTDSLVDLITGMGAPKHKILISVPAKAYKFTLRNAENNTPRSLAMEEEPVTLDRKKLCQSMSIGEWTVERDEDLTAPYAFKNTTWIAFEDETSLKIKGKYVILRDLAGLGIRDVENDLKNNCGVSLVQSIYQAFMDMRRKSRAIVLSSLEKDLKGTEIAYPRHVRSSDFRIVRVVDTEGKIRAVRENTQTAFTCTRQGYFVHPKSCNRFYRCVKFNQEVDEYSVFEFDCPAGLAFDERTEVCVWPGSVTQGSACPGSSEIEPVPRSRFRCPSQPGFYADPQNCRWFFACYDLGGAEMVPYEFRCPFGLVFDEHKLICEWPWKVPNCKSSEHSNRYSTYHYGNYEPQQAYVAQERANEKNNFDGQIAHTGQYNNDGGIWLNGQNYYIDKSHGDYNKYIFNQSRDFGSSISDEINYKPMNIPEFKVGYDGHSYNVDYASENHEQNNAGSVKPIITYGGPAYIPPNTPQNQPSYDHNYNPNSDTGTGVNYDENIYNTNAAVKPVTGYNGHTYIPVGVPQAGVEYPGPNYNSGANTGKDIDCDDKNPEVKPVHNQQNYNQGDNVNPQINYNTKNNDNGHAVKPIIIYGQSYNPENVPQNEAGYNYNYNTNYDTQMGVNYDGNIHNTNNYPGFGSIDNTNNPVINPELGKGYPDPNYNPRNTIPTGVNFDGYNYNPYGSNGAGIGYNPQIYNFENDQSGFEKNIPFNTFNYQGQQGNVAGLPGTGADCDGQVPVPGINYAGQNYNPYGTGYVYEPNQGFPGYNYPGYPNPEFVYGYNTNTNGNNDHNINVDNKEHKNSGPTKSDDCDNKSNTPKNDEHTTKGTTVYSNDGVKTTHFNSADSMTTAGINNVNKDTHATTGFTDGTGDFAGGPGIHTGYPNGNTNGYTQNTIIGYTGASTPGYGDHVTSTHAPTTVITSENGLSTNDFDKTDVHGGTNSVITIGNTNIPSTARPIVYNSSYNIGTGFPTTTIIPYSEKENTHNIIGHQGTTPVNSVIYHSQIAMGLTSTEHFGPEYTNQAEKSFTTPGQTPTSHGSTENHPSFNPSTNIYDYSKINLDDDIHVVTILRGGETDHPEGANGATNFKSSSTPKFNYPTGQTNPTDNSPYYGSSITSNNNGITNFHESTKLPSNFGLNDNNGGSTHYPDSTIPTITPSSHAPPEIELDNSGLFGAKIGTSTTAAPEAHTPIYEPTTLKDTGYKTNEYYDNGGRGTIRYNNGVTASKVTENDIQDYRTSAYTRIPNSFIISSNGENDQSTIQKVNTGTSEQYTTGVFTKEGFTKTGPTKTGITTAQIGGSGSYVIGTSPARAKPNPQHIGEQAFPVTNFGETGSTTNYETSTPSNSFTNNELLKYDTHRPSGFTGYSYPKPEVELEVKGTTTLPTKTEDKHFAVTTLSPHFDSLNNQNSVVIKSNDEHNNDYGTTIAPVTYTNNPLERFKTTLSHISSSILPHTASVYRPYIDFKTLTSSTPEPTHTEIHRQNTHILSTNPPIHSDAGVSFNHGNDYMSTIHGAMGGSDYSDITSNFDQGTYGQKLGGHSFTNYNHPQYTTNVGEVHHNNELIKSTNEEFDLYTHSIDNSAARLEHLRYNRPENLISTVNIPSSTAVPDNRNAFKKPIVAAEFSQGQYNPAEFSQQKPAHRILSNQASKNRESAYRGPPNKIINNEAEIFSTQELNSKILNNQVSSKYVAQEQSSKILNNQNTKDYGTKTPSNEIISNNAFENSYSGQNQGANGQTRTLIGSNVVTSIGGTVLDNGFISQNGDYKIITQFSGMKKNFGLTPQSTTSVPEVTTYTGDFSRSNGRNKNRNVIVKLSDLHPLILGKLSAECTCKADPFALFRGPNKQTLPINSQNRGQVDLANYDESEIYVDVDNDKENEMDIELIKNIPSNRIIRPSKIIKDDESNKNVVVKSRGEASPTNLPPIRTSTVSEYLPPAKPSNIYLPSSTETAITPVYRSNQASSGIKAQNREPLLTKDEDDGISNPEIIPAQRRVGKALINVSVKSSNSIKAQGHSNNYPKPGSFKTTEESLDNSLECARPGLFRHPKFCNKFYACHWDNWKKRYTLHVFNCPVHLAFDSSAGACNFPSKGPACQDNKLLV